MEVLVATEPCKVGQILSALTEAQKRIFLARVENADHSWSADKLAFQMKKTAYGVGATTIKKHRARLCGCYL